MAVKVVTRAAAAAATTAAVSFRGRTPVFLISWVLCCCGGAVSVWSEPLKIGVVPKPNGASNDFFASVERGCKARAEEITNDGRSSLEVECVYDSSHTDSSEQADVIERLIEEEGVVGIAVSVEDDVAMTETIDSIVERTNGTVPIVTFDSDAAGSMREAFIGTDNHAFGIELGKVLNQLNSTGGTYGIIASSAPNLVERVNGIRERLDGTKWSEVSSSPTDADGVPSLAIAQMNQYASDHPDIGAIVSVGAAPMRRPNEWTEFVERYPNLTLVCGDSFDGQLELMKLGKVDGLVGQLPFQMGELSVDAILDLIDGKEPEEVFTGTAVLEHMRFPLNLPTRNVDWNRIGKLAIMTYIYVPVIVVGSLSAAAWVLTNRTQRVVLASQPIFLLMICAGVCVMGLGIIPLSIDDGRFTTRVASAACMQVWWWVTIGFSTVFAALFSKTWRINKLLRDPRSCRRVQVRVEDVMGPFVCIMVVNFVTLACWSALSPPRYIREDLPGTDDWNRSIASYGVCRSETPIYMIVLVVVNVGVLLVANIQAYRARSIETEYSESNYISIIMASILQSTILGIPILVLTRENPRTTYAVLVNLIFLLCMATLGFIFLPKVLHLRRYRANPQRRNNVRVMIGEKTLSQTLKLANTAPRGSNLPSRKNTSIIHSVTSDGAISTGDGERSRLKATSNGGLKVRSIHESRNNDAPEWDDPSGPITSDSFNNEALSSTWEKKIDDDVALSSENDDDEPRQYLSSKQQQILSLLLKEDLGIDLDKFLIEEDDRTTDEDYGTGGSSASSSVVDKQLSALKKELLGKLR